LRQVRPWQVLALGVLVGGFLFEPTGPVFVLSLVCLFLLAWLHEFTFLMRLNDEVFPGRFDKLIWALLLIVLPPVGTLAFWSYRQAHWPRTKAAQVSAAHELS